MKFGAEYSEALRKEEYPSQWISSAISYKKLKKCIKRVREELLSLGLDHETLEALWQHVGSNSFADSSDKERMMQYQLTTEDGTRFVPKLTIALDPHDGSPMDAWLSPQTRRALQKVGKRRSITRTISHNGSISTQRKSTKTEGGSSSETSPDRTISRIDTNDSNSTTDHTQDHSEEIETIEIPLTSDSEFFQILRKELSMLNQLQTREKQDLELAITNLGKDLQALKAKTQHHKRSKAELEIWREIFRLYIESEIFMSNHESDAGVRPANKAAEHLQQFTQQLQKLPLATKPKTKEAHVSLNRFLEINTTLLRLLKFQELNRRALSKILKKFDKQTSLHSLPAGSPPSTSRSETILTNLHLTSQTPVLSPSLLARSTAYTISSTLLSLIPQLDDYLCPICAMISYKPIRLRCNHIFCIRCMIRLQRDDKDECPLCREKVVLEATEEHLDLELKRFLKREFSKEVEEKKRENELQAGRELFGEGYTGTHKCVVM